MNETIIDNENYQALANVIIKQACVDYVELICSGVEWKRNVSVRRLEEFFRSDRFELFTEVDGVRLKNMMKQLAKSNNYDIVAIKKATNKINRSDVVLPKRKRKAKKCILG